MAALFDVDVKGMQRVIAEEAPRVLFEPISNALDTDARQVTIRFAHKYGYARYEVEDDDPQGFASLADAFTLFSRSTRSQDAERRGRFSMGEKEWVALCYPGPVVISSTTGSVTFDGDTRTVSRAAKARRAQGSAVSARCKLSKEHAEQFLARLQMLIVPDGVTVTLDLDGVRSSLPSRPALRSFSTTLPTVLADADGTLRGTKRQARVTIHAVRDGETPTLYELGVPVVEVPGRWHVNVHQKVPLSRSRDTVTPAYLRAVHAAVVEHAHDLLTPEAAREPWVAQSLDAVSPEALASTIKRAHGEDAVIYDPSCPEASKRAMDLGMPVVHGGTFTREVWSAIKTHNVLQPAGAYEHLRGDVQMSSSGQGPVPEAEWERTWRPVVAYMTALAQFLGRDIRMQVYRLPGARFAACCDGHGSGAVSLNAGVLSPTFWTSQQQVDELAIHEFAHWKAHDHLTTAFYDECCRIGAALRGCPLRLADFIAQALAA